MEVRELIRRKGAPVVTVEPDAPVGKAVRLLMENGIGGLPVTGDGDRVLGFVSERDVVESLATHPVEDPRELQVSRVMRRPPTCRIDDSVQAAMARMTRERLRHLVVLDGDRIAGIISVGDIVKHRLEELELETGVLRDYVAAQRAG